jgi:MFS family permease
MDARQSEVEETDTLLPNSSARQKHEELMSRALDQSEIRGFHRKLFLFSIFVWFCQGCLMTVDGLILTAVKKEFGVTDVVLGAYNYNLGIGLFFGCFMTAVSDVHGRRKTFIAFSVAVAVCASCQSIPRTFLQLLCLRVLLGVSMSGVWLTTPVLLAEALPVRNRGAYLLLYCCGWPLGSVVSVGLVKLALPNWRLALVLSSIPATVLPILAYFYIPESPRYLISQGRYKPVKELIGVLYNESGSGVYQEDYSGIPDAPPSPPEAEAVKRTHSRGWGGYSLLIKRRDVHRPTLFFCLCWTFLAAASWGMSTWLPTIIERKSGKGASTGKMDPLRIVLINSVCDFVIIVIASFAVDSFGRKFILYVGAVGSLAASFLLSLATTEVSAMVLSGFHQMAQAILWIVLAAFTTESFPTDIRSTVYGITNGTARVGMITSIILTGLLITSNVNFPLHFISGCYGTFFVIIFFLPHDTTNKSMR